MNIQAYVRTNVTMTVTECSGKISRVLHVTLTYTYENMNIQIHVYSIRTYATDQWKDMLGSSTGVHRGHSAISYLGPAQSDRPAACQMAHCPVRWLPPLMSD